MMMKKFNQRFFLIINVILICLFIQIPGLHLYATGNSRSQCYNRLNDLVDEESNDCSSRQSERYNLRSYEQTPRSLLRKKYSNKSEKSFTRKQILCIFFCVLIISGAILVPMITPFFYLFSNAREQNDLSVDNDIFVHNHVPENIFDKAVVPVVYSIPYSEHLINLGSETPLQISDAVCHKGDIDMCCIVSDNNLLRCCHREQCHEISFSAAPENSYLIHDGEIYLMESDQQTKAYSAEERSFKIYESLIKLNEHYNRGLLGEIAKQEATKYFTNILNKIKKKMPGLDQRQVALGYFCQDGSIVRINEEMRGKEGLIRIDLENIRGEFFAASYSRNIKNNECKFGSDCALAVIGIDYNKLVKVKITDDDIERILAHELGHLIQINRYDSPCNFDEYMRDNREIDADLKSQVTVDSKDFNFDMAQALVHTDSLYTNSFNGSLLIDCSFNCHEVMGDAGFYRHPDHRCRVAIALSLSEAMQKMNHFFRERI